MVNYAQVNKGIAGVIEYLKGIENVWNQTRNLKLYDVFYHASEIIDKYPLVKEERNEDDLFYSFCEFQFDMFQEWMKEEGIEPKTMVYVGRTSSFYLTDIHERSMPDVLTNLFDAIEGGYYSLDIDKNCEMIHFTATEYFTEEEQIEENQEYMEYIADGSFLKDVKEYMSDAVRIADYIDDFKKNQIEIFTEEIEAINNDIEYDRAQQEKEENEFKERYAGTISKTAGYIGEILKDTAGNAKDMHRIISYSIDAVIAG